MASVLLAFASKRGSTAEIGDRIADELRSRGHQVTACPAREARFGGEYDAAVIGSCLYAGRWPGEATRLVKKAAKTGLPVWLFHSGPLGDKEAGESQDLPKAVEQQRAALDLRDVATFGGRLDDQPGGFIAGAMARNGMAGDWRDLEGRVTDWAAEIAEALPD